MLRGLLALTVMGAVIGALSSNSFAQPTSCMMNKLPCHKTTASSSRHRDLSGIWLAVGLLPLVAL
jgi:hypothetical protein